MASTSKLSSGRSGTIAGPDFATSHHARARVEVQLPFDLLARVALVALLDQQWANLSLEEFERFERELRRIGSRSGDGRFGGRNHLRGIGQLQNNSQ